MRRTIALSLFLALTALGGIASAQDFDAAGEASMLDAINALRAEGQLAPLARMDTLDAVARGHAAEMASSGQLAHVSPNTGTPEDRVRAAGVGAARIAENVANHRDTASAHEALLASASHRANILDPNLTHIGIGSVQTERGVYVTQVFAGGFPAVEEPAAEEPAPAPPEPTLEAGDDESRFALIPPFVERLAEQVTAPVIAQAETVAEAVTAPAIALTPIAPGPALETDSTDAPTTAPESAPAIAAPDTAPAAAPEGRSTTLSPGASSTLRELIGLGLSILGGGTR